MQDWSWATAADLTAAYRTGAVSPVAVVEELAQRTERLADPLNVFQTVRFEAAMKEADASARRWRRGVPYGPLDGVPVSIKDNVDVAGWPTLKGSRLSDPEFMATQDAPSVRNLRRAGAVIFAKTTTPEFAWKSLTSSPLNGPTRNPWGLERNSGGSTGGGTAAVAAGLGPLAHGNDGGGSLRMPPSYCGVVGLKPTNGTVPFLPQAGASARLVTEGAVARNLADAALLLDAMRQEDRRDPLALPHDPKSWSPVPECDLRGIRFAYAAGFAGAEPAAGTLAVINAAVSRLREAGAMIEDVGQVVAPLQPRFEEFWLASMAQAVRSLPKETLHLHDPKLVEVGRSGMEIGPEAIWHGLQAQLDLTAELAAFHQKYRYLITPTMLDVAPVADLPYHEGAYTRWSATTYVLPANMTGQPALSLPAGLADGLPVGLQIMAWRYDDRELLQVGAAVEAALAFPMPHPVLLQHLSVLAGGR